jgi:hypothetical protein
MLFLVQSVKGEGDHGVVGHPHEIIEGSAHYRVGNDVLSTSTGDTFTLPQNVPHIHPWNTGNDVLRWRKITQLDRPDMQLLLASVSFFESLYALAQRGKVEKTVYPKTIANHCAVAGA